MSAQYILIFKDHKVDILGTIISVKNEDSPYENNILVDNKIKELNIKKKIDDKYLKQYIKGWNIEASNNLKILFTR